MSAYRLPVSVWSFLSNLSFAGSLLALASVAACGGTQLGGGSGPEGGTGPGDGGGVYTEPDGQTCVDIDVSAYDKSCEQDSDCISVTPGAICSGECVCNVGATVSKSEQARYQAALAGLEPTSGICACTTQSIPSCLNHQCSLGSGKAPDGGCGGGSLCGVEPTGPGVGFQAGGQTILWGSVCTGDIYYPVAAGLAICNAGVWEYTTNDPSAIGGYVEWNG